jgi:GrpB-like predicted nucleotidyltransferase (UPF0157 family)
VRKTLLIIFAFCLVIAVKVVGWRLHQLSVKGISPRQVSYGIILPAHIVGAGSASPNKTLGSEWDQLRVVRDTTLKNNPDLASEYVELRLEVNEQQKELDAAMIKADPKVADILVKVEKLETQSAVVADTNSVSDHTK